VFSVFFAVKSMLKRAEARAPLTVWYRKWPQF
jgi:hypothetical protein